VFFTGKKGVIDEAEFNKAGKQTNAGMTQRNFREALRTKTCRYCGEDFYAKRSDGQFWKGCYR
jgi:hypothetical protein